MEQGKKYRVIHMIPGVQRYARESVMSFVAYDKGEYEDKYIFSARPVAGTQDFPRDHVLAIFTVPQDTEKYMNRRALNWEGERVL